MNGHNGNSNGHRDSGGSEDEGLPQEDLVRKKSIHDLAQELISEEPENDDELMMQLAEENEEFRIALAAAVEGEKRQQARAAAAERRVAELERKADDDARNTEELKERLDALGLIAQQKEAHMEQQEEGFLEQQTENRELKLMLEETTGELDNYRDELSREQDRTVQLQEELADLQLLLEEAQQQVRGASPPQEAQSAAKSLSEEQNLALRLGGFLDGVPGHLKKARAKPNSSTGHAVASPSAEYKRCTDETKKLRDTIVRHCAAEDGQMLVLETLKPRIRELVLFSCTVTEELSAELLGMAPPSSSSPSSAPSAAAGGHPQQEIRRTTSSVPGQQTPRFGLSLFQK